MIKLLLTLFILGSVPISLLEELAVRSTSLSPILEVADLYRSAGMLDYLPLRQPGSWSQAHIFSLWGTSGPVYGKAEIPFRD